MRHCSLCVFSNTLGGSSKHEDSPKYRPGWCLESARKKGGGQSLIDKDSEMFPSDGRRPASAFAKMDETNRDWIRNVALV